MTEKDMLMWDETLFREPDVFEMDYLPDYFPHRDNQLNSIRYALKPAVRGGRPLNCLLYGPTGTGKTSATMKIFDELKEHTDKTTTVKVNCQIDSTRFAVISRIYKSVLNVAPPASGVSFNRIFDKIAKKLIDTDKVLIVVLDDINYLFYEGHADEVMYSLLRAHEQYPGSKIGVIAIVNDPEVIYGFDKRVSSVFLPEEIEFPRYEWSEIDDILDDRIRRGFFLGVVSDEVRECMTEYVAESGDLRVGIDLMKRSGFNAEKRSSRKIDVEDVNKAYAASRSHYLSRVFSVLTDHEKYLVIQAADAGEISAGDLYEKFRAHTGIGYTRFYEIVNKMISAGHLAADYSGKGSKGRTRLIRSGFKKEELNEFLK
ncbi:MAG: ORC1-type DNA replication protein [Methanimicrococcus sp.]|nr:ORC1-type DNA replication protein [Methanimicrococcus sp.]